jgi:hypothetical protein
VPTRRSHISRNRTLLILLGILLAFLLTLNAGTFYSANNLLPEEKSLEELNNPSDVNGTIDKAGTELIQILTKKITSLK